MFILIRDIKLESNENIEHYINNFIKTGFINYFGLQRFGTRALSTQIVGK